MLSTYIRMVPNDCFVADFSELSLFERRIPSTLSPTAFSGFRPLQSKPFTPALSWLTKMVLLQRCRPLGNITSIFNNFNCKIIWYCPQRFSIHNGLIIYQRYELRIIWSSKRFDYIFVLSNFTDLLSPFSPPGQITMQCVLFGTLRTGIRLQNSTSTKNLSVYNWNLMHLSSVYQAHQNDQMSLPK